ncbi:thymidylate kinase [Bradyrhizobium sp. USDA 4524]|uniref:hypothetical protein n=1 Tax=unclassified Bradyrhizobium TaxID=2631580 RepID=UPI0020A020D7|nr:MULTISPECIES: hypothetical protein [unclassified Bradyrhizobium]MCP1845975.1 thymidylate kinase [Bradyrhizobium sp. USDA 4538]MCP1907391.1 thymidylate kinase [Bradyrhizobium sp. USDA 4537]MCP1985177.1 thymidylate kinase [Bradyrhizobium sp. USDA 4539]
MLNERTGPFRIAFEGIDGVGKSSVIARVRETLGRDYGVLSEAFAPVTLDLLKRFGEHVGEGPQAYWTRVSRRTKTQCFLTEGVVRPHYLRSDYQSYDVVLHDRWWQTFKAYSNGPVEFDARCEFLKDKLPPIDLTLFLRGDPDICASRLVAADDWLVKQLGPDQTRSFLRHLDAKYVDLFQRDRTCVEVDTRGKSLDQIVQIVLDLVGQHVNLSDRRSDPHRPVANISPARFRLPDAEIFAIEGVDGSGKTSICTALSAQQSRAVRCCRLSAASLAAFKSANPPSAQGDASSFIRTTFEDEFRHQTYIVDGLVQLACMATSAAPPQKLLFDRWFPAFAIYQNDICSDRELFDFLLAQYPVPETLFYLNVEPSVAVDRLRDRADWMIASLGAQATEEKLSWMQSVHRTKMEEIHGIIQLDGHKPLADIVQQVNARLSA